MAMLGLAAMSAIALAQGTTGSPPSTVRDSDIVVTALSLEPWRKGLEECLARDCPPNEDARASIRFASMLFVQGRDREARRIINAALDRNRRFAPQYPRAVASLYRSNARLAANIGEGEDARRYGNAIVRSLKAGLPADSRDVLIGEIEVADITAQGDTRGSTDDALRLLRGIEKRAAAAGQPGIVAMARLRRAVIAQRTGSPGDARKLLEPIAADARPEVGQARRAALALLFQIGHKAGEKGDTDALIAQLRSIPGEKPILLRGGPPEHPQAVPLQRDAPYGSEAPEARNVATLPRPHVGDRWADIGFWIRSDGRVSDIEVLRGNQLDDWTAPIVKQLAARLYAPFEDEAGPGQYRVEHYRLTANLVEITGSAIRRRSPDVRYEMVDLTDPETSGITAAPID